MITTVLLGMLGALCLGAIIGILGRFGAAGLLIGALLFGAVISFGQVPNDKFNADYNNVDREFTLKTYEGTTPLIIARLYTNNVKFYSLDTTSVARLIHAESSSSSTGVIISSSAVYTNKIEFQVTNVNQTATTGVRFAQVVVYDSATNNPIVWAQGTIEFLPSPGTTPGALLETAIPLDGYIGQVSNHTAGGNLQMGSNLLKFNAINVAEGGGRFRFNAPLGFTGVTQRVNIEDGELVDDNGDASIDWINYELGSQWFMTYKATSGTFLVNWLAMTQHTASLSADGYIGAGAGPHLAAGPIDMQTNGLTISNLTVSTGGEFTGHILASGDGLYDFGADGTNRWRFMIVSQGIKAGGGQVNGSSTNWYFFNDLAGTSPTTELSFALGQLRTNEVPTVDWWKQHLTNGVWKSSGTATAGKEIVNFETMTSHLASVGGAPIDARAATNNVVPNGSNTLDSGSLTAPWRTNNVAGITVIGSGEKTMITTGADGLFIQDGLKINGDLEFNSNLAKSMVLEDGNAAAPTTDGQIKYDRTTGRLQVGNGAATDEFYSGPHTVGGAATIQAGYGIMQFWKMASTNRAYSFSPGEIPSIYGSNALSSSTTMIFRLRQDGFIGSEVEPKGTNSGIDFWMTNTNGNNEVFASTNASIPNGIFNPAQRLGFTYYTGTSNWFENTYVVGNGDDVMVKLDTDLLSEVLIESGNDQATTDQFITPFLPISPHITNQWSYAMLQVSYLTDTDDDILRITRAGGFRDYTQGDAVFRLKTLGATTMWPPAYWILVNSQGAFRYRVSDTGNTANFYAIGCRWSRFIRLKG